VWHLSLEGLPGSGVLYGYRVSGRGGWDTGYRWDNQRVLLDPHAPLVEGRRAWAQREEIEQFQLDVSGGGEGLGRGPGISVQACCKLLS
jgi:pullulanase/glycogen debranching enzyme